MNPIYFLGDVASLRYESDSKSCIIEKKILESNRIIFTNKYLPKELEKKLNIKLKQYYIIQNSYLINDFVLKKKDYRKKNIFKFVYIGNITINDSYRNIIDVLINLSKKSFIEIYVYTTFHDKKEIMKLLSKYNNIYYKDTIPTDEIIYELSQYDYCLSFFNSDKNISSYIDVSQPNKFFDYYYSNLPIIANHSISFDDFILNQKIGLCYNDINEIKLEDLQIEWFKDKNLIEIEDYLTIIKKVFMNFHI